MPDPAGRATGLPPVGRLATVRPVRLLAAVLAVVALVAERDLLGALLPGTDPLLGGELLPAPAHAADLWTALSAGTGTPDLAVLAALGTVLLGQAPPAVAVLLLAAVPLSGLAAYAAAGVVVRSTPLRAWVGATWALLPVATGGLAQGRLSGAAGQLGLPLLLLGGARLLRNAAPRLWRRGLPWWLGLGLAATGALAPALWPLLVGLLLVATLLQRRHRLAALVVALVPTVLLLPGPGADAVRAAYQADPSPWRHLLLSPGGPGTPPALLLLGLPVAALLALLAVTAARTAAAGWALALTGLAYASVAPLPGLQLAAAGLLTAAAVGGQALVPGLSRVAFGWRQLAAVLVVAAAALTPVAAGLAWTVRGADGPLHRGEPLAVPAFVTATLRAEPGGQVLVVTAEPGGGYGWVVTGPDGRRRGDPPQRDAALRAAVADVLTPRGSTAAQTLADRGVRYVVLRGAGAPLAAVLDGQQGVLRELGGQVWQLRARPASPPPVGGQEGTATTRLVVQALGLMVALGLALRGSLRS